MRELLQNPYFICTVVVLIIIFILGIAYKKHWLPKKVMCKQEGCDKQATHTDDDGNPICEDHRYKALYDKAMKANPPILCPKDNTPMTLKLITDAGNMIMYTCPKCTTIVMDMEFFRDVTLLEINSYPK